MSIIQGINLSGNYRIRDAAQVFLAILHLMLENNEPMILSIDSVSEYFSPQWHVASRKGIQIHPLIMIVKTNQLSLLFTERAPQPAAAREARAADPAADPAAGPSRPAAAAAAEPSRLAPTAAAEPSRPAPAAEPNRLAPAAAVEPSRPAPPEELRPPARELPELAWWELQELVGDATSRLKLRWKLPMRRIILLQEARYTARMTLWVSQTGLAAPPYVAWLRARPKVERVFAEYDNFLKLSDPTDRPTDRPTVTLFSVLYLLNQATD